MLEYYKYDVLSLVIDKTALYSTASITRLPQNAVVVDDGCQLILSTEIPILDIDAPIIGSYPTTSNNIKFINDNQGVVYYDILGKHTAVTGDDFDKMDGVIIGTPPTNEFNAWDGGKWIWNEQLIDHPYVPQTITSRQAKIVLLETEVIFNNEKINLLDALEETIEYYRDTYKNDTDLTDDEKLQIRKLLINYDAASSFDRDNIFIIMMGTKFGLTNSDIDNLYIRAGEV